MDKQMRMRLAWLRLYWESQDAGLTYRRCGISRPTLRLWARRFESEGIEGLRSRSTRPQGSPNRKRSPDLEHRVLQMRKQQNLGARRIQSELLWKSDIRLSLATIHKILTNAQVRPLKRPPRRKNRVRYERPVPAIGSRWIPARSRPGFINLPL